MTCEVLNLRCLDLYDLYSRYSARALALEPFSDAHPSALAHEIAAEELLDCLIDESLLPNRAALENPAGSDL